MAEKVEIIIGAKDKFSGAFGKLRSSLPSIKTLAVGAGAAIAGMGTALFAMAKTTATAYDKVQKFSDRIGISVEALSKYHHVAELSGVSIEAMNMGFQRMTRRISEAEAGTGVAGKALEELGISIADIAGQAPDKQFEIIAGALEGVSFQGDKARIAMQFFDSEGVALLQTLKGGTAGLEEMKAEAEKFGLVVSAKAGANAAAFNDSLTRLMGSFKGLKNYMAEQVMPTITGLANRMADWVADNRGRIVEFAKSFVGAMAKVLEYGAYAVAGLIDAWRGLQMVWEVLKIAFSGFSTLLLDGISTITSTLVSMMEATNIGGIFDEAIESVGGFLTANEAAISAMDQMGQAAYSNLTALANEGLATSKVTSFLDVIKTGLAEIGQEGEAEPKGIGAFTDANLAKTNENIEKSKEIQLEALEALREMYDEETMSEQEKLDEWYALQLEQWVEHQEAHYMIWELYRKRKSDIEAKERKTEEKSKKKETKEKLETAKKGFGDMANIAKAAGKKGFKAYKALAIAEATISTYMAASKALASLSPRTYGTYP